MTAEGFLSSSFARHDIKLIINSLHLDILCSPYRSLYIIFGADEENLINNQELLYLVHISFIFITFMFDLGIIMKGEIRCWSLWEVKELIAGSIDLYLGLSLFMLIF